MAARILTRGDVSALLTLNDCIAAVEDAFGRHATGAALPPAVLGVHADAGSFHIKAAGTRGPRSYFAAKINGNFPDNALRHRLPTIQGVIVLADLVTGSPLAILDSVEITTLRTGAATAVAARRLAPDGRCVVTIAGCGVQGRIQLRSIAAVRPIAHVFAYDRDAEASRRFAHDMRAVLDVGIRPITDLPAAARASDIVVTCTTSTRPLLVRGDIRPGAFVAGVGADNPDKQELAPDLLASARVVADVLEQSATIGDLRHAIAAGAMTRADVYGELGQIVAGQKPGRADPETIFVFDSTGMALQDVVCAALAYERAVARNSGIEIAINA
jgi:ornithine cyclodeaminase/alanine dehydrogenase-like protein (mu-crystallin family)